MRCFFLNIFFFVKLSLCAQCITSFPYFEDFENAPSWTPSGTQSDFAWGTPNHLYINSAASGHKCWCVGGLSGTFYNFGEQSYLTSPCFDFSTLNSPAISFKLFWELEYKYDGMQLQSSIDNGLSWQTVGGYGDATDCYTQNWYNIASINYLTQSSNKCGWSGRKQLTSGSCQGGNGSTQWLEAKHCLSNLANQPNVKFRFYFGSGLTCNSYDGIAIDAIKIYNIQNPSLDFNFLCLGQNTYQFNLLGSSCSNYNQILWSFGDVSNNNTSSIISPTHVFSAPGTYTVSLLVNYGQCALPVNITKTITVGQNQTALTGIISGTTLCFGQQGVLSANVLGGSPPYAYFWNGIAGNSTLSINPTSTTQYSLSVSDVNGCSSIMDTLTVRVSPALQAFLNPIDSICFGSNKILIPLVKGGNGNYTYNWEPLLASTPTIIISPSVTTTYTLNVTDGCSVPNASSTSTIKVIPLPSLNFTASSLSGCPPLCVNFLLPPTLLNNSISSWYWDFGDGTVSTQNQPNHCFNLSDSLNINLKITSAQGCSATLVKPHYIVVWPTPIASFYSSSTTANENEPTITFTNTSQHATSILWNINGTTSNIDSTISYSFYTANNNTVMLTATNNYGCTSGYTKEILYIPNFTFYCPNSFTPNNDGKNDIFIPYGMGWKEGSYTLSIYNRWGELVFETSNPNEAWNGGLYNKTENYSNNVFTWKVSVSDLQSKNHIYTGSVTIIK
ncbi:MAG: gliding motility-associated C-terminal domain-containing protein [Bacteroidetes bacterium]|nr:gliding motility-associated C-terminal domain-containing protein [Bacteroidota bacterium]